MVEHICSVVFHDTNAHPFTVAILYYLILYKVCPNEKETFSVVSNHNGLMCLQTEHEMAASQYLMFLKRSLCCEGQKSDDQLFFFDEVSLDSSTLIRNTQSSTALQHVAEVQTGQQKQAQRQVLERDCADLGQLSSACGHKDYL
ncbi:hypothetical protein AVEN_10214-1 [Araneus ventricosus]|uniref:Uncharacterized protein n=1 Tax=Araneus ventricosus TaxID=182803 RepID=A0A4Y2HHG5_ARAVE|nr:hypothetical protein AVEN_10214-1 [Araneus ventricosus]